MPLGEAGAALLASRRWLRLRELDLFGSGMRDVGLAAFARGEWPALEAPNLSGNSFGARVSLEAARRWAPALASLLA